MHEWAGLREQHSDWSAAMRSSMLWKMNRVFLALVFTACGGEVTGLDSGTDGDVDGSLPDATSSDSNSLDSGVSDVVLPDGFNATNCNSATLTWGGACTDATDQLCETWTRDRAYGAFGHGMCQNFGGGAICTLGTYCPSSNQACQCSPTLICAPGEVCYSDTPDGATHCKPACTPSP